MSRHCKNFQGFRDYRTSIGQFRREAFVAPLHIGEIAEQLAHIDVLRLFGGLGVESFGLELDNRRFLTDGVER
jgi:hypothetical protein